MEGREGRVEKAGAAAGEVLEVLERPMDEAEVTA
jgi:hypothetical protein